MPYRDSEDHENEIFMSFSYLNLFKRNEHTEDYHIKKTTNDENSLFEIKNKIYLYVGDDLISFETNDKTVIFSSELGYNDVKYEFACSDDNLYFMLHRKYIPIQEYKTSTEKKSITIYIEKMMSYKIIMLQMKTKVLLNMVRIS